MDSGARKTSLRFSFNKAAAATLESFPQLRDVYIGTTRGPIYVSPDAAAHIEKSKDYIKEMIAGRVLYMKQHTAAGLAFYLRPLPFTEDDTDYKVKAILVDIHGDSRNKAAPLFVSPAFPLKVDAITILDHEIGHHVASGGMDGYTPHFRECVADAYAALRHVQRFGDKTDYFDYGPYTRARIITHGFSPAHYTAIVMQAVGRLRYKMDIAALSPQETTAMATDIARTYHLSDDTLYRIYKAFNPLTAWFKAEKLSRFQSYAVTPDKNPGYFRRVAAIMRRHRDNHDVWRAAKLLLSPHLPALKRIARTDKTWRGLMKAMTAHEKDSGIILDLARAKDAENTAFNDMINDLFDAPKKPPRAAGKPRQP